MHCNSCSKQADPTLLGFSYSNDRNQSSCTGRPRPYIPSFELMKQKKRLSGYSRYNRFRRFAYVSPSRMLDVCCYARGGTVLPPQCNATGAERNRGKKQQDFIMPDAQLLHMI
mmetsp:Transcript_74858/g.188473  ORF Transcript_74858/g.188473 Transcript_74858/m.188473 type:complete len:113 (+) Transcript_74858:159-497(+)